MRTVWLYQLQVASVPNWYSSYLNNLAQSMSHAPSTWFVAESKRTLRPLPSSRNRTSSSFGGGTLSALNSTATSTLATSMPSKNESSEVMVCVSKAMRESMIYVLFSPL